MFITVGLREWFCGISGLKEFVDRENRNRIALVKTDATFYLSRFSFGDSSYYSRENEWQEFSSLSDAGSDKALKLRLLSRVLANLSEDSKLDNQLNALAISAGRGLSVNDFEPLADSLVKYAKKNARCIESYVLINLSDLLSLDNRRIIYSTLEKQALRDANLAETYAVLIKDEPVLSTVFKKKLLAQKDVWQSGVGVGHRIVGDGHIKISRIDNILHFDHDQVLNIFLDLKDTVASMKKSFLERKQDAIDYGWMSEEGSYREVVMDMMFFVHHHEKELAGEEDYSNVNSDLRFVYSMCLFGKTILQMLADDQIYRAIRSMMTETELAGIQNLAAEYETLFSIMLTRDSKEIGICFQHVSWAVREYEDFFNTKAFNTLLLSVLDSWAPAPGTSLAVKKKRRSTIWFRWQGLWQSVDVLIRSGNPIKRDSSHCNWL